MVNSPFGLESSLSKHYPVEFSAQRGGAIVAILADTDRSSHWLIVGDPANLLLDGRGNVYSGDRICLKWRFTMSRKRGVPGGSFSGY